mmetsp:Transcript_124635/g.360575  ORF Transcript_124635/g.360575 Transcript_124635/m.360575 type:complete len:323 (-) Transcript_124635:1290-2258(-)
MSPCMLGFGAKTAAEADRGGSKARRAVRRQPRGRGRLDAALVRSTADPEEAAQAPEWRPRVGGKPIVNLVASPRLLGAPAEQANGMTAKGSVGAGRAEVDTVAVAVEVGEDEEANLHRPMRHELMLQRLHISWSGSCVDEIRPEDLHSNAVRALARAASPRRPRRRRQAGSVGRRWNRMAVAIGAAWLRRHRAMAIRRAGLRRNTPVAEEPPSVIEAASAAAAVLPVAFDHVLRRQREGGNGALLQEPLARIAPHRAGVGQGRDAQAIAQDGGGGEGPARPAHALVADVADRVAMWPMSSGVEPAGQHIGWSLAHERQAPSA